MKREENVDRISVEPSRRCSKGCSFCYNGSNAVADGAWTAGDLVAFARSAAEGGVRAISFGGGEPLEWAPLFDVLRATDGVLARTLTTNGLPLDEHLDALVAARPEKVHVSIHAPENSREVARVVRQVLTLARRGIPSGVNLLVRRSRLDDATRAARSLHDAGIENDRIVYLPMRGSDTPSARDVARVAGGPFQSMTCLSACGKSPRFASIDAARRAAWCSYTTTRRALATPTFAALVEALDGLGLAPCDGAGLVALSLARPRTPVAGSVSDGQ